jgi:hypothetical protein
LYQKTDAEPGFLQIETLLSKCILLMIDLQLLFRACVSKLAVFTAGFVCLFVCCAIT